PLFLAAQWPSSGSVAITRGVWEDVRLGDLPVTVITRGNLESQDDVPVYCGVEDVQRDGINGTPILWIIANGSSVKKGDLLVELESTPMREALDEQTLETEEARSMLIQAKANYDNQIVQNETTEADAKLKVKLSQLELDMFIDEENGSYRLEVEEIRRQIDDVNNEILSSQASMELKRDDAAGVQQLFKLGYAGKNELRRSELAYLQAEGQYAAKINKLETNLASLRKKENYERRMQMMKLEGALKTAERSAEQVKVNNQAKLAQMNAILRARTEQLKKEEERLTRYQTQLKACKVFAPQDGMVAYAVGRTGPIEEGIPVRFRQHMLSLPALNKMQVRTSVHESVLDQMQPGLVVSVGVDAFPDRRYTGLVQSVAVLPDQSGFLGRDTKVYETVITIDGEVESLKPGMTTLSI
ncbi:MAG: efflux RND transporter periplasmic adaptor subunit, partial [Planctomycetota bacterium]